MTDRSYATPPGGLPPQSDLLTGRAVFTEAYAVIPRATMRDIVVSALPHWRDTRVWVIARPMTGFAETFSHYICEVATGGGSNQPEPNPDAEAVLFITAGEVSLTIDGDEVETMGPGGFAYLPPGCVWTLHNPGTAAATFHWIRKRYIPAEGIDAPRPSPPTRPRSRRPRCPAPRAAGRPPASSRPTICATTCT